MRQHDQRADADADLDADVDAIARIASVPTILRVISEVTGLRLALVARVTPDRWTACAVLDRMDFGLHVGDHLEVATTLCAEVRETQRPVLVEHASRDPLFCAHPTPKMYGFESYVGVPIFRADGAYFGNVCALDARPLPTRDGKTQAMMELFAELISAQLAVVEASERDRVALGDARRAAELREQFIAVLGHDLRTPLFSILSAASFLLSLPQDARQRTLLERVKSSGDRMARLVDDVMDFARGRLGGGMAIRRETVNVGELVRGVVDEVASAHPERVFRVVNAAPCAASLDRSRAAQMVANLVANAAEHSLPDAPVDVLVEACGGREVAVAVTNRGAPIPPEVAPRLFQPFVRATSARQRQGLGLGLYIAAEIARAHGGTIHAASSPAGETTFTVLLPAGAAEGWPP